jgi:hypothetical protein
LLLLEVHETYFRSHRRARAFQWKQIGLAQLRCANNRGARLAFGRSYVARPEVGALWHLLRACAPLCRRRPNR